jgi:hypothetical protein
MNKFRLSIPLLGLISCVLVACGGSSDSAEATYAEPPQKIEALPKSN